MKLKVLCDMYSFNSIKIGHLHHRRNVLYTMRKKKGYGQKQRLSCTKALKSAVALVNWLSTELGIVSCDTEMINIFCFLTNLILDLQKRIETFSKK